MRLLPSPQSFLGTPEPRFTELMHCRPCSEMNLEKLGGKPLIYPVSLAPYLNAIDSDKRLLRTTEFFREIQWSVFLAYQRDANYGLRSHLRPDWTAARGLGKSDAPTRFITECNWHVLVFMPSAMFLGPCASVGVVWTCGGWRDGDLLWLLSADGMYNPRGHDARKQYPWV